MVEYVEESFFPFPRDQVWKLLDAHWDDATIAQIHPLVRSQKTVSRSPGELVVDRTIDANGKIVNSRWKITLRPPDSVRFDVVSGTGPYEPGTFLETTYAGAPGGTNLRTHVKGRISVLPFFLPQKTFFRRVLGMLDAEDAAYLRR
jgi:hypothetical protein